MSRRSAKRMKWIAERVDEMIAAYRAADFANVALAAISFARFFEGYDDDVIAEATHVKTGIQRTSAFPPTIAELRAFCERSARMRQTIVARKAEAVRSPIPPASQTKPVDRSNRESFE
jgi:hypothetical protein